MLFKYFLQIIVQLATASSFLIISGMCILPSCSSKDNKFQQYYRQGQELYLKHCSNCHQASGQGLGLLYPPLDKSDYVDTNRDGVICLIENGKSGELVVNGKTFNMPMPGIPSLTDLEIATIATYLYNSWGREVGLVDVKDVTATIQKCQ